MYDIEFIRRLEYSATEIVNFAAARSDDFRRNCMPANPLKPRVGFKVGSAVFGDPIRTIDCVVKREGARAARVELSNASRLPDRFLLVAMAIQVRHRCEVVERSDDWLRVQFIPD